jgi:hypothetical protein
MSNSHFDLESHTVAKHGFSSLMASVSATLPPVRLCAS